MLPIDTVHGTTIFEKLTVGPNTIDLTFYGGFNTIKKRRSGFQYILSGAMKKSAMNKQQKHR